MRSLVARIERIERRKPAGSTNRTIQFDPETTTGEAALANVGKPGNRYLIVPSWASNDAWERAAIRQQKQLLEAASRTPKPPKKPED